MTLRLCLDDFAYYTYAAHARKQCESQEALTVKVGKAPSIQAGSGGVWLTVKLWVADSNAASMQTKVLADLGSETTAEVAALETVAA